MAEESAAGTGPDPIPGLEPFSSRHRVIAVAIIALLVGGLMLSAFVPRTLVEEETLLASPWQVQVTAGLVTPTFSVTLDGSTEQIRGQRWPGRLSAAVVELDSDRTVVVGSVPASADSVRLSVAGLGLRESRVRRAGSHQVHVAVLSGPWEIAEVVAIGDGGEVIEVVDDVGVRRLPPAAS